MKNINITKHLLLLPLFAFLGTTEVCAQTAVDSKTIWVFGTDASKRTDPSSSYSGATTKYIRDTSNDGTVIFGADEKGVNDGSAIIADYGAHYRKAISINLSSAGKITLLAKGANQNPDNTYVKRDFRIKKTVDGTTTTINSQIDGSTGPNVFHVDANTTLSFVGVKDGNEGQAWINYYYIVYEPDEKLDLNFDFSVNNGTNTLNVGDWTYPYITFTGVEPEDATTFTSNSGQIQYTSSDQTIATIDGRWNHIKAIKAGNVTFTATFNGNDKYNAFTKTINVTINNAPQPHSLSTTTLKSNNKGTIGDLSALQGNTMGVNITSNVDANEWIKAYSSGNTDITSSGAFTYAGKQNLTVNGSQIKGQSTSNTATLGVTWIPAYAETVTDFTTVCAQEGNHGSNVTVSGSQITISAGDAGLASYNVATKDQWNNDVFKDVSGFKYFLIEVEDDITSEIQIMAEYGNMSSTWGVDGKPYSSGRFIYVPLRPNGLLKSINIRTASTTQTINIKSVGFVNTLDLPAEATISNITVSEGSINKFGMTVGVHPNPLTAGYQTWAYVTEQKGDLTDAEWAYVQEHWSDNNTGIKFKTTYTSSNTDVATVTPYGWVEAKAPGTTTITATWKSNDSFDGHQFGGPVTATVTLTVTADDFVEPLQPTIRTAENTAITDLEDTGFGLTTVNSVNGSSKVATFYGPTKVTGGSFNFTPLDNYITAKPDDNQYLNEILEGQTAETRSASLHVTWRPDDNKWMGVGRFFDANSTGDATINAGTHEITLTTSTTRGTTITGDLQSYPSQYNYYLVELAEPTTAEVVIAAEYDNHESNYKVFPAGSRLLYVPLYSQGQLNLINLGATTEETTIKIAESSFRKHDYYPAEATIENITVEQGVRKKLTMEVTPNPVTVEIGSPQTLTVTIKDSEGNVLTGTNKPAITCTSANTDIATVTDAGVITGVSKGNEEDKGKTKVTVAIADTRVYDVEPIEVDVKVTKKVLEMTITPAKVDLKKDATQEFTVTYKYNGNTVSGLSTNFEAGNQKNGNTIVRSFIYLMDNGTEKQTISNVTTGKVTVKANMEGTATVIAKFAENDTYEAAKATAIVNVISHKEMVYMGPSLEGDMNGTLKDDTSGDALLHWKFGAPESEDIWVFKHKTADGADKYQFQADPLRLKADQHDLSSTAESGANENPIDDYCLTRLTDNDGGGDAYTEYNGMMAGYGTENGGRYLTPISGTFIRVEPLYDGVVTIRLRHNGGVDFGSFKDGKNSISTDSKKANKRIDVRCGRRPLFVMDENGVIMQRTEQSSLTYWENKWKAAYTKSDGETDDDVKTAKTNFKPFGTTNDDKNNLLTGTFAIIDNNSLVNNRWDVVSDAYTTWLNNLSSWTENASTGKVTIGDKTYKLGKNWDYNFSKNAFHYIKNVVYKDVTDFNTTVRYYTKTEGNDSGEETTKTNYVQKLWYSASDDDVAYRAKEGDDYIVDETTYFFAKYGYECLAATHLKISFPVKAGKTYFVGANKSKVALCTIEFDKYQPTMPSDTPFVLDDTNDTSTPIWLTGGTGAPSDGDRINVKVKRKFTPGYWHPIVLPFSVSETELRAKFGDGVQVIALDGSLTNISSLNNYETRDRRTYDPDYDSSDANSTSKHISWMDKSWKPTFLESETVIGFSGHESGDTKFVIKKPAIRQQSVTFTKHYYQMLYANCPAFICPSEVNYDVDSDEEEIEGEITFKNVTFVKPTLNSNKEIELHYTVDQEIGEPSEGYHYRMVAKYQTTEKETISNDMYYISNSGGDDNVATLYHASAGENPAMKSMRVWIEPKPNNSNGAPLRKIGMNMFDNGSYVDDPSLSGISDVIMESTEHLDPDDARRYDDNVYDIMGRVVGHGSLDGLKSGLYIFHGVKTYVY